MPPDNVPEGQDYFSQYLKEGAASPDDAKHAPALQHLLGKLYKRQRDEAQELALEHQRDIVSYRTPDHPYMVKDHRAENAAQDKRFIEERDRCIRDYHAAQALREEMKQREQARGQMPDQTRSR